MNESSVSVGDTGAVEAALPVLPLWIAGHAYLTVTAGFGVVRCGRSGRPLRRFPLCGAAEIARAYDSAQAALGHQKPCPDVGVGGCLLELSALVEHYRAHLAAVLVEESGIHEEAAAAEISDGIEMLRRPEFSASAQVVVVDATPRQPLSSVLRVAVPVLRAGGSVIVLSPPEAPSLLFALAELTQRSGLPGGVFNLLHGDRRTYEALVAAERDWAVTAG